jgi:hypothetical protein
MGKKSLTFMDGEKQQIKSNESKKMLCIDLYCRPVIISDGTPESKRTIQ